MPGAANPYKVRKPEVQLANKLILRNLDDSLMTELGGMPFVRAAKLRLDA